MIPLALTLLIALAAIALALALAYLPMQLLLRQIARNVQEFISRQRERRHAKRRTPDRRKPAQP
jgi:hypothetical protein